jgi:hypothetical protein
MAPSVMKWWIGFHHIGIALEMLLGQVLVTRLLLISWGAVAEAFRHALNLVLQLGIQRIVLESGVSFFKLHNTDVYVYSHVRSLLKIHIYKSYLYEHLRKTKPLYLEIEKITADITQVDVHII